MNLYLTADQIDRNTGAGKVVACELDALRSLGPTQQLTRDELSQIGPGVVPPPDPWNWDWLAYHRFGSVVKLMHVYAGTFSECVRKAKQNGAKVTYTAAAHDIDDSRAAHLAAGIPFDYPHLNQPELWAKYVRGYLEADVVICPSKLSKECMESYGCKNVVVIPHGVDVSAEDPKPFPKAFTVGYLGAYGPDKGVQVLLEAWGRLGWGDALLLLGGRDSQHPYVTSMVERFRCSNVVQVGWVKDVGDFYSRCSVYVQPSVTEGFGCEVLEAMAHGRPVICSTGCGAADTVNESSLFLSGSPEALAERLRYARPLITDVSNNVASAKSAMSVCRDIARNYTWDKIAAQYVEVWKGLLK